MNKQIESTDSNERYKIISEFFFRDLERNDDFSNKYLAHYTSISNIENILDSEEIWFSNPLLMNDRQELRFGIFESRNKVYLHEDLKKSCKGNDNFNSFIRFYEEFIDNFDYNHAFDTYVFCFSEYKEKDCNDGSLSMWRGYGDNGNGGAIVFDGSKIEKSDKPLFIIGEVEYLSEDQMHDKIDQKIKELSSIIEKEESITDDFLKMTANILFERMKMFSLLTKHKGFSEEKEWRAIYTPMYCQNLDEMLSYSKGRNGLEPKLKFKIEPIENVTSKDLSLEKLIHKIILGPGISGKMSEKTFQRMLDNLGHTSLKNRIFVSGIPFRGKLY